jgi:large subunit ribosomal protein L18
MSITEARRKSRAKRKQRIRKKVSGSPLRPRLCVFRSAKHIYAQVIDDTLGRTLVAASSVEKSVREQGRFPSKVAAAVTVGKLIGERALAQGIIKVVFDRGGFLYHGRIKAVSQGAREAGLDF